MRTTRPALLIAALLFVVLPARAQQPTAEAAIPALRIPETPSGRAAAELLLLLRDVDDTAAVRRFVAERMGERMRAIPFYQQVATLRRLHSELGTARVIGAGSPSPDLTELVFDCATRRCTLMVTTEDAPPFRITRINIRVGGEPGTVSALPPLDSAGKHAVVDSLGVLLEHLYPAQDTGRMIADHLREQEHAGAYAVLASRPQFAEALTRDLRSVNGDRHLNVRVGDEPRPGTDQPKVMEGASNIGQPMVLDGNVGYLKFGALTGGPTALSRLGEAFRALQTTDAVILDLRGSPGGSAEMANTIISHFVAPGVPVIRVNDRSSSRTFVRETLAQVSGPRRLDVPLYVLVDARSASAAEDVPFVLQNLRRATIVGERTAGAGRNNRMIAVGAGLLASISISRVSDPKTGREWEGIGIRPDIEVTSDQALEVARHAALERSRGHKL
jgi:hypothetical protein